jgi:hypothetical protein
MKCSPYVDIHAPSSKNQAAFGHFDFHAIAIRVHNSFALLGYFKERYG